MRRFLSIVLVFALMLPMFCMGVNAESSNHANYTELQPIVRVRVNGTWYGADLTPYKGQDNVWVEIPIDATKLNANTMNYFSLSTNVSSDGNRTDGSVDLYATAQENAAGSFLCSDRWCDSGYAQYNDRNINLKVQVYEGGSWVTLTEDTSYAADNSTVLGQYQGGDWYNAARNISLGDVSSYTRARILVNMHVGKDITPLTDFKLNQLASFYSYAAAMRVRVNGNWYGVGLEAYKGENDAWVYCPIPLSSLNGNGTNYLSLSTNVKNNGSLSDSSIDLYATPTEGASGSFSCTDQYCDSGYTEYHDRVLNVRLEVYDGERWTALAADAEYTTQAHSILGISADDGNWCNAARNIALSGVDLTQYTSARVAVNLHVGSNLAVDGYVIGQFATFVDAAQETPVSYYTVTATAQEGGSISGVPTEKVAGGTQVTLVAAPDDTHHFDGWYDADTLVSTEQTYTFTVTDNTALTAKFTVQGTEHKETPDSPAEAVGTKDSENAAIRVRVNGSWYGTYLEDYKGQTSVWVPVNIDISKLNASTVNYFSVSSNVISHGNFTDSSLDLYATLASDNLNSFMTQDPYCDGDFKAYSDRNINIRLELFNGQEWVTISPNEDTYYDEHTVLGLFGNNEAWYNAARNLALGDLSAYTDARILVQLHVGKNLDVAEDYREESFAIFLQKSSEPEPAECDGGENCPAKAFSDVDKKAWYHSAIDYAVQHELFYGISDTKFGPDMAMTRGMLVTVLWRYAGKPAANGATSFTDVPANLWYADAVAWAAEDGIVFGTTATTFEPETKITREQLVSILCRYAKKNGIDTSQRGSLDGFSDKDKVSGYAKDAVQWAVAEGILSGNASGGKLYLEPQGDATRAAVASILMRYIEKVLNA